MAQADIDALAETVSDIQSTVDAYTAPAGDGTEDYSKLKDGIDKLKDSVDTKLGGATSSSTGSSSSLLGS